MRIDTGVTISTVSNSSIIMDRLRHTQGLLSVVKFTPGTSATRVTLNFQFVFRRLFERLAIFKKRRMLLAALLSIL